METKVMFLFTILKIIKDNKQQTLTAGEITHKI